MALEIAIDSIESAIIAAQSGADRIEACSDLLRGGLTPSTELIQEIKEMIKIPVFAMIRPRAGNFIYSEEEVQVMKESIQTMKELKVDGLVFGALKCDSRIDEEVCSIDEEEVYSIDEEVCSILLSESSGLPVTFHRAFDKVNDKSEGLSQLIKLGFKRVLTTGGPITAEEGIEDLRSLVTQACSRIIILPGGSVNELNLMTIVTETSVKEIHSSGTITDYGAISGISKVCSVKNIKNMKKDLNHCLEQFQASNQPENNTKFED